ncbi:DoxX family protein [Nocardia brasiliensis]|uniref:DoxX family protein n=1 Tax=Nocardia brasiliensis TaxID=37326 RepID=UPI0036718F31
MATMVMDVVRPDSETEVPAERWRPVTRVLFRFAFVYLGVAMAGQWLFLKLFGSLGVPHEWVREVGNAWSLRLPSDWVAEHVLRLNKPLSWAETGSSDTAAGWVSAFTWLLVAAVATAVWSAVDRRRPNHAVLNEWFRLLLRFSLATSLLLYGLVKVLPSQMSFELQRLVEPFGDMSPMGLLWAQTAASEPYEIALGLAEVTAALLLLVPLTATAGALLALVVGLQVLLLNLTYDVPVKLYALHLLLLAIALVVPEARRLALFLAGRRVDAVVRRPLFAKARWNRVARVIQVVLALWFVFTIFTDALEAWQRYGNARPESPLYGIWNVTEYSLAGQDLPALVTSNDQPRPATAIATERLRRVIFDNPVSVTVQRMDDSLVTFPGTVDTDQHTVTIAQDMTGKFKFGTFSFQRPEPNRLILDGQLGGRPVRMRLELLDLDRFPLVERGFHWVQETPYRR